MSISTHVVSYNTAHGEMYYDVITYAESGIKRRYPFHLEKVLPKGYESR